MFDEIGILIPSLSALKKWSPVYEPIVEKYHHVKPDFMFDFEQDGAKLHCPKLSAEDDLKVKSSRI